MGTPHYRYRNLRLAGTPAKDEVHALVEVLRRVPGVELVQPQGDGSELLVRYDLKLVRLEELVACADACGPRTSRSYYYSKVQEAIHRTELKEQQAALEQDAEGRPALPGRKNTGCPVERWDGPLTTPHLPGLRREALCAAPQMVRDGVSHV